MPEFLAILEDYVATRYGVTHGRTRSTLHDQPLTAVPLLFGAGLATSLTPCVYPMIPITGGILGGAGPGAGPAAAPWS